MSILFSSMSTSTEPKDENLFLVAPLEWPNVFRYTLLTITTIALYWVFQIHFSFEHGATLGTYHPEWDRMNKLRPIQGNGGQESCLLLFDSDYPNNLFQAGFIDSILQNYEDTIPNHLHSPFQNEFKTLYQLQTYQAPYLNFRLLCGDDPPEVRFHWFADWIDSITEYSHKPPREVVRACFQYFEMLQNELDQLNSLDTSSKSTSHHKFQRLWQAMKLDTWREHENSIMLRFSSLPQPTPLSTYSANNSLAISFQGLSTQTQKCTQFMFQWFLGVGTLLIGILFFQFRQDRKTVWVYLYSMISNGIWTLAFWKWFLQPLDVLFLLLIPLPFLFGWYLANITKGLCLSQNPNRNIQQYVRQKKYPLLGSIIFLLSIMVLDNAEISRLAIGIVGIWFGSIFSFFWSIAEWKIYSNSTPQQEWILPQKKSKPSIRYSLLVLFVSVGVMLFFLRNHFQWSLLELFYSENKTNPFEITPYWIGPVSSTLDKEFLLMLRSQYPELEMYHPFFWTLRELSKEEKQWFKPGRTNWTPLDTLRRKRLIGEREIEIKRESFLSSIYRLNDRLDNLVKTFSDDQPLFDAWERFQNQKKSVHHIAQAITDLSQDEFVKWYDQQFISHLRMKQETIEARSNYDAKRFIAWSKLFQLPNGSTIIIAYPPLPKQSFQNLLPKGVFCSGPALLRDIERKRWIFLAIALLVLCIFLFQFIFETDRMYGLNLLCLFILCGLGIGFGWSYQTAMFSFLYLSILIGFVPYQKAMFFSGFVLLFGFFIQYFFTNEIGYSSLVFVISLLSLFIGGIAYLFSKLQFKRASI
ncbi:MAG: hypothetical protein N2450_00750 [bacterium]|nr:hypothetical protein [bacterium]